jgi:hypothetical protein
MSIRPCKPGLRRNRKQVWSHKTNVVECLPGLPGRHICFQFDSAAGRNPMRYAGCPVLGGWPALSIGFSFSFRKTGCPVLAFCARAGIDAACTMGLSWLERLSLLVSAESRPVHVNVGGQRVRSRIERLAPQLLAFVVPALAKNARTEHPSRLCISEIRARATRPMCFCLGEGGQDRRKKIDPSHPNYASKGYVRLVDANSCST